MTYKKSEDVYIYAYNKQCVKLHAINGNGLYLGT